MKSTLSIRLSDELAKQLDNIAKETEKPHSYHIQKAIESYIGEFADLQIAMDRLRNPQDFIVSDKVLRKSLGL